MSCYSKDKVEKCDYNNVCKSHSARSSDRELYRICPSKLSKRELEDLYFALLENNLDLKRTINGQQDKIKGLSTKVQRMTTAQRSLQAKEMKECCVGTKSMVNEQKESITSLKHANQQMAERIRMLNMRLCSAKQFNKKAPVPSTSKCPRCPTTTTTTTAGTATTPPKKHSCSPKPSEPVLKCSVSCQNAERVLTSVRSAQTETRELEMRNTDLPCDENKCRTAMEELKQKIFNLEEELCQAHGEYSTRIGRLESEVSEVRKENVRVRSERASSEHEMQSTVKRTSDLLTSLRSAEGRNAELTTQLSMEKRKVAELDTRLKSANMSDRVNKTIEDHITTIEEPNASDSSKCACPPRVTKELVESTSKKNTKCDCACHPARPEGDSPEVKFTTTKAHKHKCKCPPPQEGESPKCTPTKGVKCFCPPPKESGSTKSSTKVSKCACPPPQVAEPVECSPNKADMQAAQTTRCLGVLPRGCADECKWSKTSDDSGYMDKSQDADGNAALNKLNQELKMRVIELQNQIDSMKITGTTELPAYKQGKSSETAETSYSASTPKSPNDKPDTETSLKKPGKQRSNTAENREANKPELVQGMPELLVTADKDIADKPELRTGDQRLRDDGIMHEYEIADKPELRTGDQRLRDDGVMHEYEINQSELMFRKLKSQMEDEIQKTHKPEIVLGHQRQGEDREMLESPEPYTPESILCNQKRKDDIEPRDSSESNKPEFVLYNKKQRDDREIIDNSDAYNLNSVLGNLNKQEELKLIESLQLNTSELAHGRKAENRVPIKHKIGPNAQELREEMEMLESQSRDVNKTGMIPKQRLRMLDDCESIKTADSIKTQDMEYPNHNFVKNDYRKQSNELGCKLRMERNDERRASKSDIIFGNPELATNMDQVPSKVEMLPGNLKLPMTDSLTEVDDAIKSLNQQDPTIIKERCKNCSKCSYQKECATMPYCNKTDLKCDDLGTKVVQGIKNDRHNSLQIPGPIPVSDTNSKDWKRSVLRRFSFDGKKKESHKNKDKKPKKTSISKATGSDALAALALNEGTADANTREDLAADKKEYREHRKYHSSASKDSIEMHHRRLSNSRNKVEDSNVRPSLEMSLNNYYTPDNVDDRGTQVEDKSDQKPQDQTLKEHTIGVQVEGKQDGAASQPQQPCKPATSEQGTYALDSGKQTRGTSPDTDGEISSMTDLPSEGDAKSPVKSRPLSPGEDKMTSTYTDSYTAPATPFSLSEGEMPCTSTRRLSNEQGKQDSATEPAKAEAPAQKMEAALQAISDELARCKNLLLSQRPTESTGESTQASASSASSVRGARPIALRRGVATQSIGDTTAPHCIFTLHIGTVVLSDEAVLNSRNKNLVLTWKFYDQNTAMTRMHTGRVVLFDFSTEYDIKVTDEFLHYMKHEEMPILISELDKPDQPFASCTLPLRDALLHTNRRADISLALLAGPQMLSARAGNRDMSDSLDAGDEMGVIDLWCLLRADTKLLSIINRAIARPAAPPVTKTGSYLRSSQLLQQVDDEPSNEFVDLDLSLQQRCAEPAPVGERTGTNVCKDVEYTRTSRRWGSSALKVHPNRGADASTQTPPTKAEQMYDASRYPPVRPRRTSVLTPESDAPPAPPAPPAPSEVISLAEKGETPSRDASGIIVNEVETRIKMAGDLKQALDKSTLQSDFTRLPDDEIVSQAHSSFSSLRSIVARMQRRGSAKDNRDVYQDESLLQNMRRPNKTEEPLKITDREDQNDMEIYKKYDNISKLIGPNRAETVKKVKIVPQYKQEMEEPQRDNSQPKPKVKEEASNQRLEVTVLWLALNEECEAMVDPHVQRVYVAYSFLGRSGAELETPNSLPKPKHYVDKCYFNFKKSFELEDSDLPMLGHMARCRAASKMAEDARHCIVFSVVSEPAEDPLGLESCEDIGHAYLYLGDLLAYSTGSSGYTEVIPVRAARGGAAVCGVLAVRLDGLDVVRRCLLLSSSQRDLSDWNMT